MRCAPSSARLTWRVHLLARQRRIDWPRRPLVMGIVNINDDSFSGDGTLDVNEALEKARILLQDGADVIDAGAESARTNRPPISIMVEIERLRPFWAAWPELLDELAENAPYVPGQLWPPLLSLNTWRPQVVEEVLTWGETDILNDIGALPDAENARLCARHGAALIIMHSVGQPKVPHTHVAHEDVMNTLEVFFAGKIALCEAAGLSRDSIILDPGLDFAKQLPDNLRICRELSRLRTFDRPILLPISRKTFIGETLDLPRAGDRDAGTIAALVAGAERGAALFRVHHVEAAVQTLRMLEALESGSSA